MSVTISVSRRRASRYPPSRSANVDRIEVSNEFIRKPKWRTRTTPGRRALAVLVTFALVVAAGAAVMLAIMVGLDRLGAPPWLVAMPWIAPTVATLAWTLARPAPAVLNDDDDDRWTSYSLRTSMVGHERSRPALVRVIAAVVFGAPIVWVFIVLGIGELLGAF